MENNKVAIVTGGTRGIGAAICTLLASEGFTVAATYAGNDESAAKFTEKTGIKTYKWNVADFDSCQEGVDRVTAELGPVSVVINTGLTNQ